MNDLYREVKSWRFPHTHDGRTDDPCNSCGATRKWVLPVPDGILQTRREFIDSLNLQAMADELNGMLAEDCPAITVYPSLIRDVLLAGFPEEER